MIGSSEVARTVVAGSMVRVNPWLLRVALVEFVALVALAVVGLVFAHVVAAFASVPADALVVVALVDEVVAANVLAVVVVVVAALAEGCCHLNQSCSYSWPCHQRSYSSYSNRRPFLSSS